MDIRQFSPQTQQTLAKRDFNGDAKLSKRELEIYANMPEVQGIAPQDLALIKAELKKAKGPETIIVNLVEEELPPGVRRAAPTFPNAAPAPAQEKRQGGARGSGTQPAGASGASGPKGKGNTGSQPGFQVTATQKDDKKAKPATTPGENYEVQARGQAGPLSLRSNSNFNDGRHKSSRLSAGFEPVPFLGLTMGIETSETEAKTEKAKPTTKPSTGKKTTPAKPATPAPTSPQTVQNVNVNSQVNAGPLKLTGKGQLDSNAARGITNMTGGAELTVLPGHAVKAEVKAGEKKTAVSKVGSSHEVVQGVNVTTAGQFDDLGKLKKYGGGLSYSAGQDSGFRGLSFSAEALAKHDSTFTRPMQGWEKPELKFEFRFTRPLS